MARIKVRARALDMLGRQQMASIPNALHELFKNAHDAYADCAEIDFFRAHRLLVLRDDGVGMTLDDFENRWLILGTESKLGIKGGMNPPHKDPKKPERPTLGEKGIGRLAIAAVGPQVFVFTRAEREDGLRELVFCLINWTFFEAPGISLDDIDIPILTMPLGQMPGEYELSALLTQMQQSACRLKSKIPREYYERINNELDAIHRSRHFILSHLSDIPLANKRGTAFLIYPVDPLLEKDIEDEQDDLPSNLLKILRGFSNTMVTTETPALTTAFRDHHPDGRVEDIIAAKEFFTPEEFLNADHHFEGFFDEYGQFVGSVKVYREEPVNCTVPWDGARGEETQCGPFAIKVAYIQGVQKESLLPAEEHFRLCYKLNKFGGLYVYRDGIRILPYGNSDFDFLNIERRRTKSAADWYFSYRRIFGAVQISVKENFALIEKAGREGFRENKAYRQFKEILENFFKSLALDWFREKTSTHGKFHQLKEDLKKQALILEKRQKSVRARREVFKERLDIFFKEIENDIPRQQADMILKNMQDNLRHITALNSDDAAKELLNLEATVRCNLTDLRDTYRIPKPRNVGLTKVLLSDYNRCANLYMKMEDEIFAPLEREADLQISGVIDSNQIILHRHKRIQQAIETHGQRNIRKAKSIAKEANEGTYTLIDEVVKRTQTGIAKVDEALKCIMSELGRISLTGCDDEATFEFQQGLESKLEQMVSKEIEGLERLRNQIQSILDALQNDSPIDETTAALEEKAQILEEQLDNYTELAQLGSAIGIIQHEFQSTVHGVRKSIHNMHQLAIQYPELRDTYLAISSNFEHLDTYLAMFSPLNRRLYRKPIKFTGKEIARYLYRIFAERIKRHKIDFETTAAFEIHSVHGYPSIFLPSIINVVDNAIYWLSRSSAGEKLDCNGPRQVILDADENGFLISNNGPGIEERDAESIFDLSFTRKLQGRGMGLAVARKALREEGFEILLDRVGRNSHPCFRIRTVPDKDPGSITEEENTDV